MSIARRLGLLAKGQRRYSEAEKNYRKALDTFLKYDDYPKAAIAYNHLGDLAALQERYNDAETSYRKALHIRRVSDRRAASHTATKLGMALAALGQHYDAARNFLYAAVGSRQETGQWDQTTICNTCIKSEKSSDWTSSPAW